MPENWWMNLANTKIKLTLLFFPCNHIENRINILLMIDNGWWFFFCSIIDNVMGKVTNTKAAYNNSLFGQHRESYYQTLLEIIFKHFYTYFIQLFVIHFHKLLIMMTFSYIDATECNSFMMNFLDKCYWCIQAAIRQIAKLQKSTIGIEKYVHVWKYKNSYTEKNT
jgi:hypothetical protein